MGSPNANTTTTTPDGPLIAWWAGSEHRMLSSASRTQWVGLILRQMNAANETLQRELV